MSLFSINPKPSVSSETFLGLVWASASFSTVFVFVRLFSSYRGSKRLFLDDFFIIAADILVLTTAAVWQWAYPYMYDSLEVGSGMKLPDAHLASNLKRFRTAQFLSQIFFYTSLVTVKLSFLFFFKRLGRNVRGQRTMWWAVLAFCISIWIVSVADIPYKCLFSTLATVIEDCTSKEANDFSMICLRVNMALDIFSDFLIILIPVIMLWNVQIPLKKKLAFIGLFSLGLITIVIAIVRTVNVYATAGSGNSTSDAVSLAMWSAIQTSLAIIVSCLSSFPRLFSSSTTREKPVWTPTETIYARFKNRSGQSGGSRKGPHDLSAISKDDEDWMMEHETTSHGTINNVDIWSMQESTMGLNINLQTPPPLRYSTEDSIKEVTIPK